MINGNISSLVLAVICGITMLVALAVGVGLMDYITRRRK